MALRDASPDHAQPVKHPESVLASCAMGTGASQRTEIPPPFPEMGQSVLRGFDAFHPGMLTAVSSGSSHKTH